MRLDDALIGLITEKPNDELIKAAILTIRKEGTDYFFEQENTHLDFKDSFPFSYTDEYFLGIARLVNAFYNTYGGVIVFGVHDKSRESHKNKVIINIEKFNTRLRELFDETIECIHRPFRDEISNVDLLIVPRRAPHVAPVFLQIDAGAKYRRGMVWLRRAHEVRIAKSSDLPFLFSPRSDAYGLSGNDALKIDAFIPPSSATVPDFVGRLDVLRELYNWITRTDEPRKYLWGRGGSGKSTIAHEFASLIRDFGKIIPIDSTARFDRVIFLTAKEKELNPETGKIFQHKLTDFTDFRSLCESLGAIPIKV